ncbi:rhodanese-related sulfurtransferase [Geothermobacter ehrlichii]|uniref:Rhodanese-related sulfurtransferase n=1 Tax=Geothermobacter ehrlichii TaxID=213224 RepID=A0A5D3WLJ0_9BACT|nr:rhodanese-like domain-containing protein [Geothermobacter ehrlichii]TYP00016.1 rhodanese-related sulfurtransferase [Geothermobacter ehrlichii]
MKPETLLQRLGDEETLVIDVRLRFEFRAGHIPGAVNIPWWRGGLLAEAVAGAKGSVVLTCEHGPRAWLAAGLLLLRGQTDVSLLSGHMRGWRRKRLPLVKE